MHEFCKRYCLQNNSFPKHFYTCGTIFKFKHLHFAFALSKIYLFQRSRINYDFAFEYVTQNFESFERRSIASSRTLQSKRKYFQIVHG